MHGNLALFEEACDKGYEMGESMRVAAMNGQFDVVKRLGALLHSVWGASLRRQPHRYLKP